jgi:pimeloyl-ACP methyl ester carboxylesterase
MMDRICSRCKGKIRYINPFLVTILILANYQSILIAETMRTKSGLIYEILDGGNHVIVACTCWTEATTVIHNLDNHWLRRLAREQTMVITNRRGFAGSSGRADLDSELLGLREVVDAVGAPVVLLGGCEASVVPIALAARYPERVQALIIVNGTARFATDENYPGESLGSLQLLTNRVRVDWEGFFRPFLSNDAPVPWTDIDSLFELFRQFVTGEALTALCEGILQVDVRQELTRITAPTLVIHSTEDEVIPFSQAQYLAAHIAGAKLHALHGGRHHIAPSYNDEIARTIREFLTGIAGEITNVQLKGKLATIWGVIRRNR